MARRYSPSASKDVEREMHRYKRGEAKSGRGGKGGKVKSRKQAIAIGLSKARKRARRFHDARPMPFDSDGLTKCSHSHSIRRNDPDNLVGCNEQLG